MLTRDIRYPAVTIGDAHHWATKSSSVRQQRALILTLARVRPAATAAPLCLSGNAQLRTCDATEGSADRTHYPLIHLSVLLLNRFNISNSFLCFCVCTAVAFVL